MIFDHLLTGSGRIGRRDFSLLALSLYGLWLGLRLAPALPLKLSLILSLALIYMGLCLVSQRLHDLGRAGWWIAPALAVFWAIGELSQATGYDLTAMGLFGLIIGLGLIAGGRDHNRYGPLAPPIGLGPRARPRSQDQRPPETRI